MRARRVTVFLLALLAMACCFAQPAWPGRNWTPPDASGWSAEGLREADETARAVGTTAYMVVHQGRVVHTFGPVDRPGNIHSMRKSILSVLYGIEAGRGHVDLSRDLASLAIDDREGLTAMEKRATVRQLLQARSCIYHPSAYEPAEMTAHHPARGTCSPGERFEYNNWDFNALGTIFKQASGRGVFDSLDADLARPLGFEDFSPLLHTRWVYERRLSEHPAYEMRLSVRDLARVGLMMARGGEWKGQRILSPEWVRESTRAHSEAGPGVAYGYLWWVGTGGWAFGQKFPGEVFSARGNHGQYMIVDPGRDLVIVHRVDSDRQPVRAVGHRAFGQLIGKVLAAGPGLVVR